MEREELRQTLEELTTDLLAPESSAEGGDASAILQSLVLLTLRFPSVQKVLSRSLSSPHSRSSNSREPKRQLDPSKLSVLATRFLYRRETSRDALELLAALAAGGPRHQERVVQSVTGVVLTQRVRDREGQDEAVRATVFDAGKIKKQKKTRTNRPLQAERVLYVVTIPDAVKAAFRGWRKRYKCLQNRRLPSGIPPEQGGVPRPCYCDDCLGVKEQFFPTWSLHFQDLDRWTNDAEDPNRPDNGEPSHEQSIQSTRRSLASDALAIFLHDFQVVPQTLTLSDEQQTRCSGSELYEKRVLFYYFVQREASETQTVIAPAFDPRHHASAIEIVPEVAGTLDATRLERKVVGSRSGRTQSPRSDYAAYETVSASVLVLEDRASLLSCGHDRPTNAIDSLSAEDGLDEADGVAGCGERIAQFLRQLQASSGAEAATKTDLESTLCLHESHYTNDGPAEARGRLMPVDCDVVRALLAFLDSDDFVSLPVLQDVVSGHSGTDSSSALGGRESEHDRQSLAAPASEHTTETHSFHVQILVRADSQELVVQCSPEDRGLFPSDDTRRSFSTVVTRDRVLALIGGEAAESLALLCIDDDQLRAVLARCRVCSCLKSSRDDDSEVVYLRPQQPIAQDDDALDDTLMPGGSNPLAAEATRHQQLETTRPVTGLSNDLTTALAKLETLVRAATATPTDVSRTALATKLRECLRRLITSCNARVTALTTCTDSRSTTAASDTQRKAGVARCRHCRDLLIQLGKRVQLTLEPRASSQPKSDALGSDQLARVAKLVRKTVAQVEAQSLLVQAWETPDVRVSKLQLDRRVWASGFPDPEFYREGDAREAANKKLQRKLTRQLVQKRHQRS